MDTTSKLKVAIIDYEAGNVQSIANTLSYLNISHIITSDKNEIKSAEKIIFPGQGHFEQAIKKLKSKDMFHFIQDLTTKNKDFLWLKLA